MMYTRRFSLISLLQLGACANAGPAVPSVPSEPDPGSAVTVHAQELQKRSDSLVQVREESAEQVRAAYPTDFNDSLGYDPKAATYLEEIINQTLGDPDEQVRDFIAERGFAIVASRQFPSFASGYSEIYLQDLPVYVTADMVLEALYRSHDKILQDIELARLRPLLGSLLSQLRQRLVDQQEQFSPDAASDLDFYLAVAQSLLRGGEGEPNDAEAVDDFVKAAMKGQGTAKKVLFGVEREIDFSQFKPRGHYDGEKKLESYFRSMIWLGRIDFRLIETQSDGTSLLRRRQVDAMLALRALFNQKIYDEYLAFDHAISAFVGEHDYMTLQEVSPFSDSLGKNVSAVDDDTLAQMLVDGQYGQQRIASHIMRKDSPGGTFPLNVSFALLGQRYTVDSHVFSQTVYDRLPTRVVPNPLDVGFAALGNNQALALLGEELDEEAGLPGALSSMRSLVDDHDESYWQSSFYSSWLGALRALSPASNAEQPSSESGLPTVAQSEWWGRRLLSTQLSSWAQLRHNNVLYVKQSYSSGALCEYPDAYVDPYPNFFSKVVELAERGQQIVDELSIEGELGEKISQYFSRVAEVNTTLAEMATLQRSGEPHSAQHLDFINRAVYAGINCDGTPLGHSGWYADLHFEPLEAVKADPIITDVHTDVGGDLPVAREPSVLHVGTGLPQLMIVTVDSCAGPRAYAGVVSAYHESRQPGFTRLTDEEWSSQAYNAAPVDWMSPVVSKE